MQTDFSVKKEVQVPFTTRDEFKKEDGTFVLATITPMSAVQNSMYRKKAMKIGKKGKFDFDQNAYTMQIVLNHLKDPDFADKELLDHYAVLTPEDLINTVLLAGEVEAILNAVVEHSGLNADLDDVADEVKN
jgi:hypothetical protein